MRDLAIRTANREDIPQLLNLMYQYIVDFYKRPKPTEESLKGLIQHLLDNPCFLQAKNAENCSKKYIGLQLDFSNELLIG
ncbi:hypothetical protein [Parageobacillus thermoglucosidasius]|uniref:hypothetical protein n=1 Tax=Parageobacillus thermoglucosidasius TaxID=1426 RepID=UPI0001D18231|nr:hypothetical protein [Parageobacillus thermoglucosidasius]